MQNHTVLSTATQAPTRSKISGSNIPDELRALPQWVCWKYEPNPKNPDKPKKVPWHPSGDYRASTTNPASWSPFMTAAKAYATDKTFDGIGFVFSATDAYTGIDFDDVIAADGSIADDADADVRRLASYAERSVSGTGIHCIVRAALPTKGKRRDDIGREIYDAGRFFVFTGHVLADAPTTIADAQVAVDELYRRWFGRGEVAHAPTQHTTVAAPLSDYELQQRMFASKDGADIRALWNGDESFIASRYPKRGGGGDNSAADLALCNHLAWWTNGDSARIDSLFRQSSLMRDKWNRADYRDATIGMAISGTHGGYSPVARPQAGGDDGAGAAPTPKTPQRVEIDVERQHRDIADDCLLALCRANDADPKRPSVLIAADALAMVAGVDDGSTAIHLIDADTLTHQISRHADFISWRPGKDDAPPRRMNRAAPSKPIAGLLKSKQWPGLPRLDSIVRAPQFTPGGDLVTERGYDALTHKWLDNRVDLGDTRPTPANVVAAKTLLMDTWLGDFPFAAAADKAHAIALLLEPWLRCWFDKAPLWLITASAAGSGKTLLGQLTSYVYGGEWPDIRTMPEDGDELRKELVTALITKPPTFFIDNIAADLDSPVLAAVVTSGKYSGRVLGANVTASGRTDWTWLATSNNPRISDELARRSVLIRLEPNCEAPELRTDFLIGDIAQWTEEHRDELVTAAITLIRNWIDSGRRVDAQAVKGSFASWSRVVGGVLKANGIVGFLANEERLRSAAAPERDIWRNFVAAWWRKHRNLAQTAGELFELASYADAAGPKPRGDLLGSLKAMSSDKERGRRVQLGTLLQSKVGTVWNVPDIVGDDDDDSALDARISTATTIDVTITFVSVNRLNAAVFQLANADAGHKAKGFVHSGVVGTAESTAESSRDSAASLHEYEGNSAESAESAVSVSVQNANFGTTNTTVNEKSIERGFADSADSAPLSPHSCKSTAESSRDSAVDSAAPEEFGL